MKKPRATPEEEAWLIEAAAVLAFVLADLEPGPALTSEERACAVARLLRAAPDLERLGERARQLGFAKEPVRKSPKRGATKTTPRCHPRRPPRG